MISMKKKLVTILITVLLLLAIIIIGGSFYMLSYSLQPKFSKDEASAWKAVFSTYPHLAQWVDSLNAVSALKDTFIVNPEGKRLHAYHIAAPQQTAKTAVIIHGYTDSAIRMMMMGYMFNHELNYNILLPDLQFHGLSEGTAIQMGWKDRLDVLQWMNVANDIYGKNTQMVIHGISMGGATTMMISGEELPPYVKCFIDDCGYTSVWDQFSKELNEQFNLPEFPLMHVASWLCSLKYGWNFKEASSLNQVKKSSLPMLFIHGDNDDYVPTQMVYPLYNAKSEPKKLWIVPGAAHATSYRDNPEEYTMRVKSFLESTFN